MNGDKKLHKLVQNTGKDRRESVLEDIHKDIDEVYLKPQQKKSATHSNKRRNLMISFGALSGVVAVVLCLVLIPKPTRNTNRYCTIDDYVCVETEMTIEEYNHTFNTALLYFNWYNDAEYVTDIIYRDKKDDSALCITEEMINGETGQRSVLSITDLNTYIDALDRYSEMCQNVYTESEHSFLWAKLMDDYCCIFEWGNYRYYLEISDVTDLTVLAEIVNDLIAE